MSVGEFLVVAAGKAIVSKTIEYGYEKAKTYWFTKKYVENDEDSYLSHMQQWKDFLLKESKGEIF